MGFFNMNNVAWAREKELISLEEQKKREENVLSSRYISARTRESLKKNTEQYVPYRIAYEKPPKFIIQTDSRSAEVTTRNS